MTDDTGRLSIELYGAPTGNCLRAAIALEESGLVYTPHRMNLRAGEHLRSAYLALNPVGKVPLLIERGGADGDFVLTQSNAIMFYAASRAPGTLLSEGEGPARARAIERLFYFVTDVIAPNHAGFFLKRHHLDDGATVLARQSIVALREAERFLVEGPFMAGNRFTMVDISAFTIVMPSARTLDWEELPRLRDWYDRMLARSGVERGMHVFDEAVAD